MSFSPARMKKDTNYTEAIPPVRPALTYVYGDIDKAVRSVQLRPRASVLQGCLPLFLHEVPLEELATSVGQKRCEELRAWHREMSLLNLWYQAELQSVLQAITTADIPVLVLKGVHLASSFYPQPDLRYFDDIDLMVHPQNLASATSILEQLGYTYYQEYRFEEVSRQRAAFVYVKAVAVGYVMFELHTSPHANELFVSFDAEKIWERSCSIDIAGVTVQSMSLEDLFLYICWHYRSHDFARLIWLYDAALILLHANDQLDWTSLFTLARQQGLLSTLFYVIQWSHSLFHIPLSDAAAAFLDRSKPSSSVHWLIQHFIGTDTTSILRRSSISRRKLLQYLMVDDAKTLFLVSLRIFFPSPTHLGRLYMEHSFLPLRLFWLYYFYHPFIALHELMRLFKPASK
jgi:hypothetical protein